MYKNGQTNFWSYQRKIESYLSRKEKKRKEIDK